MMCTQLCTKKWLRWYILSILQQYFEKGIFFQFPPPTDDPHYLWAHLLPRHTFHQALTFVGGAATILPLSIGNWQPSRSARWACFDFDGIHTGSRRADRTALFLPIDSGLLGFFSQGSEGTMGFLCWCMRGYGVLGWSLSLGPSFLIC